MRPVLTPEQMGAADRAAIAAGTPEAVLVARAGAAVERAARRMLGGVYGRRVVVVCGKGNNGADGVVAAGRLRALGVGVDAFALADGVDERRLERALRRADLAIDAMFGTGFRGELDGDAAVVARQFRSRPTLAVDIPSGIDGLTGAARGAAVGADATVCFAALKPGLLFEPGRTAAGRVHVADIGIDVATPGAPSLSVLDVGDLALPARAADAHKWSAAALVVGGSPGMYGAPTMAARAAARCGAGMVVCGLPGAVTDEPADEIVSRALPATPDGALDEAAAGAVLGEVVRFAVVAIGPGLGRDPRTRAAVRTVIAECPVPVVVDADALHAIAGDDAPLAARRAAGLPPAVLTPHAGEYAALTGVPVGDDRVAAARTLAARTGAVVLVKGPGTVVAAPDGAAVVNRTDGPALAAAGTGDVLTGIVAGLIAGGAGPFRAAATAAYLHGRAASAAGTGPALVAPDLVSALAPTLVALRTGRDPWED